jgi:hypothetical protein
VKEGQDGCGRNDDAERELVPSFTEALNVPMTSSEEMRQMS